MNLEKAAVFGGSGKIGRRVIAYFEERGIAVRALEHKTPVAGEKVERIRGSIADPAAVRAVIDGTDVVVQLATTKEEKDAFFDVTLRGMINILEACRETKIQQLILLGGDAAFGIWFYPQPLPIDENHPYQAYPGYYAFTKVIEEVMAQQYAIQYGIPVSILRSSWVFTADDILRHLSLLENVNPAEEGHGFGKLSEEVLALIRAGEDRVPILRDEEGTPYKRHIVHIDDVMQAFGLIVGNPAAVGESFNIAGPAPFRYDVAARYLSERTGVPTIDLAVPGFHSFEINISRARSLLGYEPRVDIFAIIDRALEYRRERAAAG